MDAIFGKIIPLLLPYLEKQLLAYVEANAERLAGLLAKAIIAEAEKALGGQKPQA